LDTHHISYAKQDGVSCLATSLFFGADAGTPDTSRLYRRYSTDLLKMCFYVRKLLTNPKVCAYLDEKFPDLLGRLRSIVFEAEG